MNTEINSPEVQRLPHARELLYRAFADLVIDPETESMIPAISLEKVDMDTQFDQVSMVEVAFGEDPHNLTRQVFLRPPGVSESSKDTTPVVGRNDVGEMVLWPDLDEGIASVKAEYPNLTVTGYKMDGLGTGLLEKITKAETPKDCLDVWGSIKDLTHGVEETKDEVSPSIRLIVENTTVFGRLLELDQTMLPRETVEDLAILFDPKLPPDIGIGGLVLEKVSQRLQEYAQHLDVPTT